MLNLRSLSIFPLMFLAVGCQPTVSGQAVATPVTAMAPSAPSSAAPRNVASDRSAGPKKSKPGFTANVMAPLWLSNDDEWKTFGNQLDAVKGYGADAVSVDVWWGRVEPADNAFDWSYYDKLFDVVAKHELKLVPILSFHQCGGNVGDTCDIRIPAWLFEKYRGDDLMYKSEQGNSSRETIQPWADDLVMNEYQDLTRAFVTRYGSSYETKVLEINVSLGPSGELRYPSYNAHDKGSGYPTRGALQAYSQRAVADFRRWALQKYKNLAGVNLAWGTSLPSEGAINPPSDGDRFFTSGSYKNIQYGKDFVDWYNQSLVSHGKRMLEAIAGALGNSFLTASLGYKVPGVHWAMTHPNYPRAAEVAAGIVQTSVDMNNDTTGHGYGSIVGLAKKVDSGNRPVILHFTCLEMDDAPGPVAYSQAKSLVFWVAQYADRQGVIIKGENALAGNLADSNKWNNIFNAFDWAAYVGFTALRIGDVSQDTGANQYRAFIGRYR